MLEKTNLKNNFFSVLLGTSVAKIVGFFREFLFLIYLGNSTTYSEILSLLVISTLVMFLSDSAFLNPIIYPQWERTGKQMIKLNAYHLLLFIVLSIIFYIFNEISLQLNQPFYVKIICSFLWIPLLFHGFGYSFLLYTKKLKTYNFLINIIAITYLIGFWFLKDFGSEAYIISRFVSIVIGVLIVLFLMGKSIKISFKFTNLNREQIFDSTLKFLSVNNFILSIFIIRLIISQFFQSELAVINYTLVIIFIFYTLINKNLNALTILENAEGKLKGRLLQKKYFLFFLVGLILTTIFINSLSVVYFKTISQELILNILYYSLFLLPTLMLCGNIDLKNSEVILNHKIHYNWRNFTYIILSVGTFFGLFSLLH